MPCVIGFANLKKWIHLSFKMISLERILSKKNLHLFPFEYHRKQVHTSIPCVYAWAMNQTNYFCPFHLPPSIIFLLSSFILKFRVLDGNQDPKTSQNQAMNSKAKIMLDEFVYQWKMWSCSFVMVCNCSTA